MDLRIYDFLNGQSVTAFDYFGAHFCRMFDKDGVVFRVYAPLAKQISLIGEFNGWDPRVHVMSKIDDTGVYEIFVPGLREYQTYKYHNKSLRDLCIPF